MMGNIYHEWNGTTLIITSDSGTSACDLKGDQGDIGIRGPVGSPGAVGPAGTADLNIQNGADVHSLVGGFETKTSRNSQTALGEFNADNIDALLIVGNGANDESRANAFVVLEDGRAQVQAEPTDNIDIVRLKELNEVHDSILEKAALEENTVFQPGEGSGSVVIKSYVETDEDGTQETVSVIGATGQGALALAKGADARGKRSKVLGKNGIATEKAWDSLVLGQVCESDASGNLVGGIRTINRGNYGITFGTDCETGENVRALNLGISNTMYPNTEDDYGFRFAIGTGLSIGNVKYKSALGQYNVGYSDAIFEYGNGEIGKRKNVFDITTTNAIRQYGNKWFINQTENGNGFVAIATDSIPAGTQAYVQLPTESGKLALEKNTVAKVGTPMTLYATNNKGEFESTLKYSYDPIQYTIPRRYTNGNIIVPVTPGANDHAASKSYVDTQYNNAKQYTDTKITETKQYVDTQIAEVEIQADKVSNYLPARAIKTGYDLSKAKLIFNPDATPEDWGRMTEVWFVGSHYKIRSGVSGCWVVLENSNTGETIVLSEWEDDPNTLEPIIDSFKWKYSEYTLPADFGKVTITSAFTDYIDKALTAQQDTVTKIFELEA